MFDRVQILPNTLKHVETCLNSTKQGGQTEKCFANQQCFTVKHLPFKRKHYEMDFYLSERKSFQAVSPNMLVEFWLAKPKQSLTFANKRINIRHHIYGSSRKNDSFENLSCTSQSKNTLNFWKLKKWISVAINSRKQSTRVWPEISHTHAQMIHATRRKTCHTT